ncbi:GNAT family N-acetyltransferase [Limimaricola hongkongensis]|uniref:L-ornithine N(alpha)-acyltransferase n=1 Tax=Limimaricola hongkongensis DSM 17492 TaxID=1122180 RepID=A0A017HGU4_9RHOB|nr:GNAT family N-acyltransferase [Limimaricola hongkongensis]EYD73732.1 Putative hemolysin [Limimaricola hongkongensis DSM 17492]
MADPPERGVMLRRAGMVAFEPRGAARARAMALRARCFVELGGALRDEDGHDATSRHLLVEDGAGRALCALRWRVFEPAEVTQAASAASYDLSPLAGWPGRLMEIGRFCTAPEARDGAALRLALAALTRIVVRQRATLLFGCASFAGTDPAPHAPALAWLGAHHAAPRMIAPGRRAGEAVALGGPVADPRAARAGLPPLLRSYLGMGGVVGDHAVIDRAMNTLHVLCMVDVAAIPAPRARALRALAFGP